MDWNMDMTRYGDKMDELNNAYGEDDDDKRDDDSKMHKMATGWRHLALAENRHGVQVEGRKKTHQF